MSHEDDRPARQVVVIDVDRLRHPNDLVEVVALALHWAAENAFHYVATVRIETPDGPVTRDFHDRCGSWMTDRTDKDRWPAHVAMKEMPDVGWTLQALLGRRLAGPRIAWAKKEAEAKARGWKWPPKRVVNRERAAAARAAKRNEKCNAKATEQAA